MTDQFTALRSSVNQAWGTPRSVFDPLNAEFDFTIDAAASAENALLPRYWDLAQNALFQDWDSERVWCNPPYGEAQRDFIRKASRSRGLSVLLIPARTDTSIWHSCIHGKAEVRFVKGRIRFEGAPHNAPFASAIVIFRPEARDEDTAP
jgi:phage N-6-adenine-methyltransferase